MGEQLVRVTIIILAAIAVAYGGKSAYTIGLAGALASIAGSCVALVVLGVYFCKHRPVDRSRSNAIPWTYYLRMLVMRSEEHTSELQSRFDLVCRLLL